MESTYYKDGEELSQAEGERIMESFGKSLDITPLMQRLQSDK